MACDARGARWLAAPSKDSARSRRAPPKICARTMRADVCAHTHASSPTARQHSLCKMLALQAKPNLAVRAPPRHAARAFARGLEGSRCARRCAAGSHALFPAAGAQHRGRVVRAVRAPSRRNRAPLAQAGGSGARRHLGMALPPPLHRRGSGSACALRGRNRAARECPRVQAAFSATHGRAPRSSRSGAARARAPLAVSAEAPKWNVVPPTKVNVRRPALPACRARARFALRRRASPRGRLHPPCRQRGAAAERGARVQSLINDKGYTFLDIRTGNEYRKGSGLHWCAPRAERSAAPQPLTACAPDPGCTCRWRRRLTTM